MGSRWSWSGETDRIIRARADAERLGGYSGVGSHLRYNDAVEIAKGAYSHYSGGEAVRESRRALEKARKKGEI